MTTLVHGSKPIRISKAVGTWLAENLAYQYADYSTFRFGVPAPKAIHDWIYKDSGSAWGHRHNVLQDPFADDTGVVGQEALIGFGIAQGEDWMYAGVNREYAYIEGLYVYDPRSTCSSLAPAGGSAIHADYGDLPASYGAAWHTQGGPSLGTTKSLESTMSSPDTTDDGVALIGDLAAGQPATLRVNVQDRTPETGRWLRAWFDWNNDGGSM